MVGVVSIVIDSNGGDDSDDGDASRKKLRLSMEQSMALEKKKKTWKTTSRFRSDGTISKDSLAISMIHKIMHIRRQIWLRDVVIVGSDLTVLWEGWLHSRR